MAEEKEPDRRTGGADTQALQGEGGGLARGDPEKREAHQGRSGGGESAGGAYPHPDREGRDADGFMGHGGQSEMGYHGEGRLGARKVGRNDNAPAETDSDD